MHQKTVFDSTVLIDCLNGKEQAFNAVELANDKYISVISYIEAFVGVGTDDASLLGAISFLSQFQVLSIDMDLAYRTIGIRKKYRFKLPDAVIYATAEQLNAQLVSRNTKDFKPTIPLVSIPYTLQ